MSLLLLLCLCSVVSVFGQIRITGKVTDAESGEPLVGANILIKGTSNGAAADIDGNYQLQITDANAVLVVSYTGYVAQEVNVAGRTTVDILLQTDAGVLDEVVVVGYGSQRKSDLTGAVSSVQGDALSKIPTASVQQALQGKIAGVQVVTASGQPGAGAVIRIRGVGTLNDANPLYVVDGVILPEEADVNSLVSANDIDNISVLKDASASAIYGARGANGVILITTKRGTGGDRSAVSFSSYYGTQEIVKTIPLANAREYAILANEVYRNETGLTTNLPFPDVDAVGEGTDWQNEVYQTAPIQNYNLSLSGSSEKVNYTVSGDYFGQEGIIPGSVYNRLSVRANSDYRVKPFLKIGHNLAFIYTDENFAPGVTGNAYQADPTVIGKSGDGKYGDTSKRSSVANPLGQLDFENDNNSKGNRLIGTLYADVSFLKSFTFRSSFGLNFYRGSSENFVPIFYVTDQQRREINGLSVGEFQNRNWLWENTLSYNKEWRSLRLNLVGGITAQDNYSEGLSASGQGLAFENRALRFIGQAVDSTQFVTNHSASSWSMLSYLFRANTTLFEKYLLTASIRADGSSRFGKNNRFGYFPSFALGWRITEEPFMDNQTLFTNLKLRAGWGQTGNDRVGGDYASKARVTDNLYAVFGTNEAILNGISITELSNPDLKWESTTQANVGLEMGFFNNKLSAEIDYYNRQTNDILYRSPIPFSVGLEDPPVVNIADVRNTGVDLLLTWQDRKTVGYRITITGSTIKNEVLQLGEGNEERRDGGLGFGGELGNITRRGIAIASFYGYETDGVIQNQAELNELNRVAKERTGNTAAFYYSADTKPGDLKFRDANGDGIVTTADRVILGSPIPDVVFGANVGIDFMGIELTIDFAGQAGNEIINSKKMARFNTPNFERSFIGGWTVDNPSNTEPRLTNSGNNYLLTPRFIEDGSFVALRNVQLGYTLPSAWTQEIRMSNVRVYVTGSNLKYWTKYTGYTPEIASGSVLDGGIDRGIYPISRVYTVGLSASF